MQTHGADFAQTDASLAPAKINLTLRISGRRADGFHELESLVAFAPFGDRLTFSPDGPLHLDVSGPMARGTGPLADNLVLRAARALAERIEGLRLGRFALHKELPSGAGLGGGSADAAAALRLIAKASGISLDDPRIHDAARATGADILVCLDSRPRIMRGVGEILSAPATLPPLGILIVHPGFGLPTGTVFKALGLAPGQPYTGRGARSGGVPPLEGTLRQPPSHGPIWGEHGGETLPLPQPRESLLEWLASECNDLELPAITIAPALTDVLGVIAALAGCRLARMSGSGSACFGLFDDGDAAAIAAGQVAAARPRWWVCAGTLGA
jgi:4-diphosphocytidyl-2-C-methyl-D-erythritol kinase